jgi:serine O-acetyltransferase
MLNAADIQRAAHRLQKIGIPFVPALLYRANFLIFNSAIHPSATLGDETRLAYGGIGVVIHGDCRIGRRVIIGSNVTIGGSFGSGVPSVGDNVWISSGAKLIGDIHVGDNVIIGLNAVVRSSVPPNSVVAGVPARVIRTLPEGALDALNGCLRPDQSHVQIATSEGP